MVLGHDIYTSVRTQDVKIKEDISFDSMLLSPYTLEGLKTSGFYVPSPIQLHGIPLGKCGFDLLLEAKSGTGKTAVFSVIALEKLNLEKGVQTLILAPTREIASQICDVIKTIGAHFKGLSVEVVMGGLPFAEDVEKFKKKVHIVVGSPGRLHYLILGKHIDVSSVRLLVLDEADKLVEISFLHDINYIFSLLPKQKQVIMSSATYPDNIRTIMSNYVQNAHHICPDSSSILLGIEQNVILVQSHVNIVTQTKYKYEELIQILSKKQFKQCLVFCNYQVRVGEIHRMLVKDKWPADKLHGQQDQADRLEALKILQNYECRILVTTDLAARGIDASNVDLVINFEIPYDWQTYLHRIGRAGRFGSYGSAITILCKGDEVTKFKKILSSINIPFDLKYLWSKKPFLLDGTKDELMHQVDEPQQGAKDPVSKLGIKETFEELWKMLSVDSTETKDITDIPTFDSMCDSFQKANQDSSVDVIETFSDLLTSYQKHEIKSYEKCNYKTVDVNKMIVPCTIFNRNIVLQHLQKQTVVVLEGEEKNNNKPMLSKPDDDEIEDEKKVSNTTTPQETQNGISKLETKDVHISKDSNKEPCKKTVNIIKKSNDNASGIKGNKSNTVAKKDFTTASTSNNIIDSTKNEEEISFEDGCRTKSHSKETNKIQQPEMEKFVLDDKDDKQCDKSDSVLNKSGYSDYNFENNDHQIEYNADEKSLLAANLPTAFGKVKQRKNNDHQIEYNADEISLLASNLPTAFGKVKQRNYTRSKKQTVSFGESHYSSNSHTRNSKAQLPKNQTVSPKLNRRFSALESSDDESIEDVSDSYRTCNGNKSSKRHNPHFEIRKHGNNANNSIAKAQYIDEMKKRQQQFNNWYQQLQAHMQMIEMSVYIQVMSSSNYY